MKIYVVRHGTTVWNEQRRIQGRKNNRLSKNGIALAEKTAKKLQNEQIDIIYSSPLMRTMQTANIVNFYHNVKILKSELLTEVDQGIFAGRLYKSLNEIEKLQKLNRHPNTKMETLEHAFERTKTFIETVLKNNKNENILIVSHNNICSMLELIFTKTEPDFSNHDQMNMFSNAEVRIFEL